MIGSPPENFTQKKKITPQASVISQGSSFNLLMPDVLGNGVFLQNSNGQLVSIANIKQPPIKTGINRFILSFDKSKFSNLICLINIQLDEIDQLQQTLLSHYSQHPTYFSVQFNSSENPMINRIYQGHEIKIQFITGIIAINVSDGQQEPKCDYNSLYPINSPILNSQANPLLIIAQAIVVAVITTLDGVLLDLQAVKEKALAGQYKQGLFLQKNLLKNYPTRQLNIIK
ncbi:UNKNOWN [Stylonychia lemnae]|uniref:Uncharacterized protein n=1 Tax=Stylonychia lemnae TaxID=5949 RepID=A0A078A705_STYLE|nr:UNKNOWN [Stylonychia lemnae]|eukprot:CDW77661.1 UNKNOWN [Stylonychia lemnae]